MFLGIKGCIVGNKLNYLLEKDGGVRCFVSDFLCSFEYVFVFLFVKIIIFE